MVKSKNGRVIIVCGGAGGIGRIIVKKLITEKGTTVVVADIDSEAMEDLRQQTDNQTKFVKLNVESEISLAESIKIIKNKFYGITDLVSLAGGALRGEWMKFNNTTPGVITDSIHLNLTSHLLLARAFAPLLAEHQGDKSITFFSTINALRDYGLPVYSAAKAGLLGATTSLAADLGRRYGIRVNTIIPGTIPTPKTLKYEPKNFPNLLKGTALGKFATAEDIAEMTWFLIFKAPSTTGAYFVVDAGQNAVSNDSFIPDNWERDCLTNWLKIEPTIR